MDKFHTPVLLKEVIEGLDIKSGGKYIDATLGGGGHTREILKLGGIVLGIDRDEEAIKFVKENFKFEILNFKLKLAEGNFSDIEKIAHLHKFEEVDGILFDLGVSSFQIDESGRGFSFLRDEALDMRMNSTQGLSAWEVVNRWSQNDLYQIFSKLGEEHNSRAISDSIVRARRIKPINTTKELAEIVANVVGERGKVHPATKVFQAIRIVVNSEIENLKKGMAKGFNILKPQGKMAVISFHSLEDRAIKLFFQNKVLTNDAVLVNKKPITPEFSEMKKNRRSRSSKLRILKKL